MQLSYKFERNSMCIGSMLTLTCVGPSSFLILYHMLSLGLKCYWIVTHLFALLSRAGNLGLAELLLNKYLLAPPFIMFSFQKVWFLNFSPLQAPPIDLSLFCHHINRLFIYLYHSDYFKLMFYTVFFFFLFQFSSARKYKLLAEIKLQLWLLRSD